jgi:hypothetical protein
MKSAVEVIANVHQSFAPAPAEPPPALLLGSVEPTPLFDL